MPVDIPKGIKSNAWRELIQDAVTTFSNFKEVPKRLAFFQKKADMYNYLKLHHKVPLEIMAVDLPHNGKDPKKPKSTAGKGYIVGVRALLNDFDHMFGPTSPCSLYDVCTDEGYCFAYVDVDNKKPELNYPDTVEAVVKGLRAHFEDYFGIELAKSDFYVMVGSNAFDEHGKLLRDLPKGKLSIHMVIRHSALLALCGTIQAMMRTVPKTLEDIGFDASIYNAGNAFRLFRRNHNIKRFTLPEKGNVVLNGSSMLVPFDMPEYGKITMETGTITTHALVVPQSVVNMENLTTETHLWMQAVREAREKDEQEQTNKLNFKPAENSNSMFAPVELTITGTDNQMAQQIDAVVKEVDRRITTSTNFTRGNENYTTTSRPGTDGKVYTTVAFRIPPAQQCPIKGSAHGSNRSIIEATNQAGSSVWYVQVKCFNNNCKATLAEARRTRVALCNYLCENGQCASIKEMSAIRFEQPAIAEKVAEGEISPKQEDPMLVDESAQDVPEVVVKKEPVCPEEFNALHPNTGTYDYSNTPSVIEEALQVRKQAQPPPKPRAENLDVKVEDLHNDLDRCLESDGSFVSAEEVVQESPAKDKMSSDEYDSSAESDASERQVICETPPASQGAHKSKKKKDKIKKKKRRVICSDSESDDEETPVIRKKPLERAPRILPATPSSSEDEAEVEIKQESASEDEEMDEKSESEPSSEAESEAEPEHESEVENPVNKKRSRVADESEDSGCSSDEDDEDEEMTDEDAKSKAEGSEVEEGEPEEKTEEEKKREAERSDDLGKMDIEEEHRLFAKDKPKDVEDIEQDKKGDEKEEKEADAEDAEDVVVNPETGEKQIDDLICDKEIVTQDEEKKEDVTPFFEVEFPPVASDDFNLLVALAAFVFAWTKNKDRHPINDKTLALLLDVFSLMRITGARKTSRPAFKNIGDHEVQIVRLINNSGAQLRKIWNRYPVTIWYDELQDSQSFVEHQRPAFCNKQPGTSSLLKSACETKECFKDLYMLLVDPTENSPTISVAREWFFDTFKRAKKLKGMQSIHVLDLMSEFVAYCIDRKVHPALSQQFKTLYEVLPESEIKLRENDRAEAERIEREMRIAKEQKRAFVEAMNVVSDRQKKKARFTPPGSGASTPQTKPGDGNASAVSELVKRLSKPKV
jgi:hypothetical protein